MRVFAVMMPALLMGCAASIPPVSVTRFHVPQAIPAGGVEIVRADGGDSQSLEFRSYAGSVARQLALLGYSEGITGQSPFVAEVDFARGTRTELVRRSPVSIGLGTGSFGRRGGFGLGTSFGVGGNKPRDIVITSLSVRLKARSDGKPVWEGRAETQARSNAPSARPGLAADKLAVALFKGFPGVSGETISVP